MNGRLPTWLEEWLGLGTSAPGEGTVWHLHAESDWASWLSLLAVLVTILWVVALYARDAAATSRRIRGLLIALRFGAFGILALMVAELVLSFQRTGLPTVAVVLDTSGSMAVAGTADSEIFDRLSRRAAAGDPASDPVPRGGPSGPAGEVTRLDLAKYLLLGNGSGWLAEIERRYHLVIYSAATNASPLHGDLAELLPKVRALSTDGPGSEKTRLGTVLRQVLGDLKGPPPTAVVFLSDGITTDGETLADAAELARRRGVPLFTVGLGDKQPIRDVDMVDLLVDEVVFVGDIVTFEARLIPHGLANTGVMVQLKEKDEDRILAATEVVLGPDEQPQTVRLQHRVTQAGNYEFTVEVIPADGEIQIENNRQTRLVSVHEEKIRVLYAQARPNYEYRFLKHVLERDTTIDLDVHLQEADSNYADVDQSAIPVFPVRREDLFAYDVILLGDLDLHRLTRSTQTHLREFVEQKGGGLLWIAGPRFLLGPYREAPELAPLFPFHLSDPSGSEMGGTETETEGFVLRPTELGLASGPMQLSDPPVKSEQVWRQLPALYWFMEIHNTKRAARILAEHPTRTTSNGRPMPMIILQFVGAGKVLFHATDETWRWRFRTGDMYFARYWIQSIRYLARSKLIGGDRGVELTASPREVQRGDPIRIRVRFLNETMAPAEDDGVTVVVERAGGKRRRVTLERDTLHRGIFQSPFGAVEPGRYHVLLVQPNVEDGAPTADFRVIAPPGELENITLDTDELATAAAVSGGKFYRLDEADPLPSDLPEGAQVPILELPPVPLWNRWWMVLLLFGILVSEWILRKRQGML